MTVRADYLVIGTGLMGMAFTDALVTETDATGIQCQNPVNKHQSFVRFVEGNIGRGYRDFELSRLNILQKFTQRPDWGLRVSERFF